MRYGVAAFPSKKLQDLANSYRKRYDTKYAKVPPHITLKEPFDLDESEVQTVIEKIREIAKSSAPFDVSVLKFSSFYPVTNTLYMKLQENNEMRRLQEKLNEGELDFGQEHPFVPHITIGQEMDYDELSDVYGRLKMEKIEHHETIDRFSLLYQLEDGTWTAYETFLLGGTQ
ncbi:YjcG family protein [Salisediminibacterium halotolerans]|uniref:YjcG family protein n=1 Tax=Salisediminibacterium halotolerans TaxID=517425 RepID=UPI000EAE0E0F|nr:YjcG family protein [Salisediminibacterium halotolerans]RLJ74380.1 2'-5' RNA ligase [Actinophytocola xinjiangensis]RPE87527.1 2'-5' RNA ligase [Salisediminibacterium halotolerans]TWG35217.1 2'-5' RNA ligase [Salisediminibacterium halotolerans]GEL08152.1 putative phosphoesterase YjcG [Salisediminibacterium halotolerans]